MTDEQILEFFFKDNLPHAREIIRSLNQADPETVTHTLVSLVELIDVDKKQLLVRE